MNAGAENKKETHADEPVFDLNAPPDETLDEEKVHLSIYNDINPDRNKTNQDREWNVRVTCTAEWFIRCSYINKFLFLDVLCQTTTGHILQNVLKSMESIFSKDVLESLSHESTDFPYDRIPVDDNRALEPTELNQAMKEAFLWFLNVDPHRQFQIILKLLRLGGGGLVFMIYKTAERYYKERQAIESLLSVMPIGFLSGAEGSKQKIKDGSKSKVAAQNDEGKSFESENDQLSEFAHKKQQQLERRNAELLNYKKLRGILEDESKKAKKGETKETVDYLQILPIRLNRKIMSYIDDKTLAGFKKVGKYWGKMIDESINEKSGRKAINAKINKIIGIKAADKEEEKKDEKSEVKGAEFVVELGPKDLIHKKNETEGALIATSELYEVIFSKKYAIKSLDSSFFPERCGTSDNKIGVIACSTPNNSVQFYSARTGARFNHLVFGLESVITCLSLHENKIHIFIGCKDGTLICKDIRTNKTTSVFNGHSNAVLSIFTTPSNLLSASLDNTIKYFRLWSGLCLLCIDLNPDLNISSLLLRGDKPSWAAIGTVEGALVLADVEARKFLRKTRLHTEQITQLAHDGEFLITGSRSGKIRIWNMNHLVIPEENPEDRFPLLTPYYNIDVGSSIFSLTFHKNQVFCGCGNGTVKIFSLATGKVFKTLKISSQTPIKGVDVTEDKLFMKLIIWHEKGIEIRSFSLQKSSCRKISKGKDNQESKQKAPKETKKNKTSEMVLSGYIRPSQGLIEPTTSAYKRTTFTGIKKPLQERCCTLPSLRTERRKFLEFNSDVFSEVYNLNRAKTSNLLLCTFPRIRNINPNANK